MSKFPPHAKQVFRGVLFEVWQWEQKMFDGTTEIFEALTRPDSAVTIGARGGNVVILEQEQPDKGPFLSLPGGRCHENEDSLVAAKREFEEETGLASEDWTLWKTVRPFINSSWSVYFYVARNCFAAGAQKLDAGEKIRVKTVSFEDFLLLSESPLFFERELIPLLYYLRLHPKEKEELKNLLFR